MFLPVVPSAYLWVGSCGGLMMPSVGEERVMVVLVCRGVRLAGCDVVGMGVCGGCVFVWC